MSEGKTNIWKYLAIGLLVIVVVCVVVYFNGSYKDGVEEEEQALEDEKQAIYNLGFQEGNDLLLEKMLEIALACQPIPIQLENGSINLIPIECLEQQG